MTTFRAALRRGLPVLCAGWALMAAGPGRAACVVTASIKSSFGPVSPNAIRKGASTGNQTRAGLACDPALLVVLGNNRVRATLSSANGLKLYRVASDGTVDRTTAIPYSVSANRAGTAPFTQGGSVDYLGGNLLNVLGLTDGAQADAPLFLSFGPGATVPLAGTYRDRITIGWNWYLCSAISLAGLCVGTLDRGSDSSVLDVTLVVSPQDVTVLISSAPSWDPVNGVSHPKALPGSRRVLTAQLANPDIVGLDSGSLAVVLPTPAGMVPALDGDGASAQPAIAMADGTPPSTLTLRYRGPGDMTDDVDFSSDGGATWGYVPSAGDPSSEAGVTHIRLRLQGSMAGQSAVSVKLSYLTR